MDLFVTELFGYGDLQISGNDLVVAYGYESLPFLALFGGEEGWWGNALLQDPDEKFNSITERTLREVALNSGGRIKIEAAIKTDLEFIRRNLPGAVIRVNTFLTGPDRLDIQIFIDQQEFNMRWNPNLGGTSTIEDSGIFTPEFTEEFG